MITNLIIIFSQTEYLHCNKTYVQAQILFDIFFSQIIKYRLMIN